MASRAIAYRCARRASGDSPCRLEPPAGETATGRSGWLPVPARSGVPPPLVVPEYRIELRPGDRTALELEDERAALVYLILNRGEGGGLTANLQGPLVFNPSRRLGRQLVLTSSRYAVRYPLSGQAAPTLLPGPSPLRATA